jgi:hypothetical protein
MAIVNMRLRSLLLVLALLLSGTVAWAQEKSEQDAPEILTSELTLKTLLETDRLEVTFVIVDTDNITEVKIDGQTQAITPGDTVQITRNFVFKQDVTRVTVSATDEKGNTREVVYTVLRPGVDPAILEKQEAVARWFGNYDVRFEYDSNPTLDLSLPFSISGVPRLGVKGLTGDTRYYLAGLVGITKGMWTGLAGLQYIKYSRSANENYGLTAIYLGGGPSWQLSDTSSFGLTYLFTDLNLGPNDYAQTHTFTPVMRWSGDDGKGGTTTTAWAGDLILKIFANGADNATDLIFRRQFDRLRANKLDRYRSVLAIGTTAEDAPETKYSFVSGDWDWFNRYDSGLLWDIGFGLQFRNYPDSTPLVGSTRLDFPVRLSTGLGYQIKPTLKAMGTIRYVLNVSNGAPYVRTIVGIGVNGTF